MENVSINIQLIINIVLIAITIIGGFVLHKKGKPYNGFIFTIHKFATIGFVAYLTVIIFKISKQVSFSLPFYVFVAIAAICVLALLISGALLSLDKLNNSMLNAHRLATIGLVVCVSLIVYNLLIF
ncbi:MAG TPA: hypothetical protein PL017_13075 [Tenuifilaceae bacterium]|nr:hypothetical protein [Tenuifilaceae bacterium]